MAGLTLQERRVILFLLSVVLAGAGINAALKLSPDTKKWARVKDDFARIDLNLAGYEELSGILGLSPVLSRSIISYRHTHGPFRDIEELKNIRGIGEYRYGKLKDLFYIEEDDE